MGKGPLPFKGTDVTRAFKAAKKAGVPVKVDIDLERKWMTLTPVEVVEVSGTGEPNEWDEIHNGKDKPKIR
jgi:hypothetical protein